MRGAGGGRPAPHRRRCALPLLRPRDQAGRGEAAAVDQGEHRARWRVKSIAAAIQLAASCQPHEPDPAHVCVWSPPFMCVFGHPPSLFHRSW